MRNLLLGLVLALLSQACNKEEILLTTETDCKTITILFKVSKDTVIHWHNVCDTALKRYEAMPKEFPVSWCDTTMQIIVFSPANTCH